MGSKFELTLACGILYLVDLSGTLWNVTFDVRLLGELSRRHLHASVYILGSGRYLNKMKNIINFMYCRNITKGATTT